MFSARGRSDMGALKILCVSFFAAVVGFVPLAGCAGITGGASPHTHQSSASGGATLYANAFVILRKRSAVGAGVEIESALCQSGNVVVAAGDRVRVDVWGGATFALGVDAQAPYDWNVQVIGGATTDNPSNTSVCQTTGIGRSPLTPVGYDEYVGFSCAAKFITGGTVEIRPTITISTDEPADSMTIIGQNVMCEFEIIRSAP